MSPRGIPFSLVVLALVACEIPNPGIPPAPAALNFPIALAMSDPTRGDGGQSDFLLVVNANYDARYNQGTVLSLDMRLIQGHIDEVRRFGRFPQDGHHGCMNPAAWDDPNVECQFADAVDVMANADNGREGAEVWIDSFASGIVRSPQGDRFYLPTRGTADLTWIDFDNDQGRLLCEQSTGAFRCADRHRTTELHNPICAGRTVALTGDPSALIAMRMDRFSGRPDDADRDVLLMLQRNGTAALYLDQMGSARTDGASSREPRLTHLLTGLPQDAINAELEPSSGLAWVSTSSPVSTRATRVLGRVGVFVDPQAEECSQAFAAPSVFLDGLATGFDSRDVAFSSDPENRFAYVLSRLPESVITIDQDGTPFLPGNAAIVDVDDVGFGPSRMRMITMAGRDFLVATSFDGGAVWVLSTQPTQVASIIPGSNGPFELAIDAERRLAIVADFKTSVIRLIDLAPVLNGHDAVVLGRVGTPRTHVGFP
jgi:hypothetical protein